MKLLDEIRLKIEKETGISLFKRTRERSTVYNRAIFVRACRVCTFKTFQEIADYLSITPASVIHSYYRTFPTVQAYESNFYKVYSDLVDNYKYKKDGVGITIIDKQQDEIDVLKKIIFQLTGDRILTGSSRISNLLDEQIKQTEAIDVQL